MLSENAEATYQELTARGVRFLEPPKMMPWRIYAQFADPDGDEFLITSTLEDSAR